MIAYIRFSILALIFLISMTTNIIFIFLSKIEEAIACQPIVWTYLLGIVYLPALVLRSLHGVMLFLFLIMAREIRKIVFRSSKNGK